MQNRTLKLLDDLAADERAQLTSADVREDGKYIVYIGPLGGRRKIKLDLAARTVADGT
jgi:hypothetical protein